MAVKMSGRYTGQLKVELHHEPSGMRLSTAAPVDNNGDGSSFSPTDLVAAALGACMLTIVAMVAERDGLDTSTLAFECEKHMQSSPRQIGAVPVKIFMPAGLNAEQKAKLERAALTCPVHRSLLAEIDKTVTFVYPDA
ncbi:osmotically inducible protein OsmC [bacterium SCN 62-11]|nr:OsmC family protein [Candidatus Eremiobacteraeota bacterium]ODT77375.1 MAG: osmotically inducible protein OsmC [bacterium SCN 62-11]